VAWFEWFTTFDLKSGYRQADLHTDKEKTAFLKGHGLWEFTVITIGPCNALATFEGLMVTELGDLMTHVLCIWKT
jgi:hypothetical protein